jgi:YggT family protein
MTIISGINDFIWWGTTAVIVAGIILILLRSLFNYTDANPFKWSVRNVRRATDPILTPVRRMLMSVRVDPSVAPFIAVLGIIVAGYLLIQVAGSILNTIAGVLYAATSRQLGAPVAIFGYLLFGFLGLYTLAIFIRIIFMWVGVSYANRLMRFLFRLTEPLLGPLRRSLPPVGMFDVSPIVAFLILWLCQIAVAGTLLKGWVIRFF